MSHAASLRRTRISLASDAGGKTTPFGWIGALTLHVAIVAATFITWQHKFDIVNETPFVPVDIVTLADTTNVAPTVREEPKIEPQEEFAAIQPDAATPPDIDAEPAPDENAKPLEQKPQSTPVPSPREETKPRPEKKKAPADPMAALLDQLTKPEAAPKNARVANQKVDGIGRMNAMTADLQAMIQGMIYKCWNPPAAAPHPERLIVTYRVFLNPDGSVAQAPQLTATSSSGDPYLQAAKDSAVRAIYVCAPYSLPASRYQQWRDITITFDPRKMAGVE